MMTQTIPFLLALMTHTFHLPEGLLSAECFVESGHNPNALHRDDGRGNSIGECQVKLSTARTLGFRGTERELQIPKINIYYAAKYLSWQLHRYHGDTRKAIAAYNAGSWRVNARGQIKNRLYVAKVLAAWDSHR